MVEIIPYQSSWPSDFRAIASRLRQGLGDLALRIDHIGSSSVPGLAAKDVIDIQITVANLNQELLSAILALDYSQSEGIQRDHRPTQMDGAEAEWEMWYFKPPPGQRRTHIRAQSSQLCLLAIMLRWGLLAPGQIGKPGRRTRSVRH